MAAPAARRHDTAIGFYVAALASLLLHVLVGWLLWTSPTPSLPPGPIQVSVEVVSASPPPAKLAQRPKTPMPVPKAQGKPPTRADSVPTPPPGLGAPAAQPAGDQPLALGTPSPLILTPSRDALPWVPTPSPSSEGRTLHPGDSEFSPEVIREAERERVGRRVQGFAEDELAEARAQRGLPHPYLSQVRAAMVARLGQGIDGRELGLVNGLQGLTQNYTEAASEYARTGNPGLNLGTPGSAPLQSEKLHDLFANSGTGDVLRTQVQARETLAALEAKRPIFHLSLEARQARDGKLLELRLVESSGSPKFDAYVLRESPDAIRHAGAPPADAVRGDVLRTVWAVEGWLDVPDNVASSLLPAMQGVPLNLLAKYLEGGNSRINFNVRLLRVY